MTTERMIRGMNIEARCSPEESMSHAADADGSWSDTGFRLAFDSENRFIRGGGWRYSPQRARVALRDYDSPVNRHAYLGFRLVRAGGLDE